MAEIRVREPSATTGPVSVREVVTRRRRRTLAAGADSVAWVLGIFFAVAVRFEYAASGANWLATACVAVATVGVHVAAGWLVGVYRGRYVYGSFDEVRVLGFVGLGATGVMTVVLLAFGNVIPMPRGTLLIAFPVFLVLAMGVRYLARLIFERAHRPAAEAEPTLIVGAGYLANMLLHGLTTDPHSPIRPVGLLDDDPEKSNLRVRGVQVVGTTRDIERAARDTGATRLIIAIGQADSALLRRLTDRAEAEGLSVSVTPSLGAIVAGDEVATDVRDISIEDLIGRHPVDTNVEQIAGYVTGKRVLVTGAGGSIGAELCRQLAKYGPSELIMLDRDETGLQMAQLGTAGHGLLDSKDVVLADIRDAELMRAIFADRRPEVVFHAAALKHLPMLEQYPDEAWKTNVLGTLNIINAARAIQVETFVNISTDKAANPTSVLGHSKRVAEKLTAWAGSETNMTYLSVRFGNVIGSRGSMLPTFQRLIAEGKSITVTHPEATRYFMTIPEACQLVIQAGGIGRPGEVLILDMGQPVSILEVAKRMVAMSGKHIPIVFTGLRVGEKLHEELVGANENLERPFHPKISHARANIITPETLDYHGWMARMFAEPRDNETAAIGVRGSVAEPQTAAGESRAVDGS